MGRSGARVAVVGCLLIGTAVAARGSDLASAAQGTYLDEAKGTTVTVTRVAAERVRVTSSDSRVKAVEIALKASGSKVVQASGETAFTLDRSAHPARLQLGVAGGATWSGRRMDLADAAQGTYFGDVISDPKGSSKSDVTLTLTRIGENRIRITSDYPRLPTTEVNLTQAMGKILSGKGDTALVLDRSVQPAKLDVSFHDLVSWAGVRK